MKNRWLMALAAVGIHVSIGSIYAYSAWKMPLENALGWSSTNTSTAFSIAIFFLGVSAAFLGRFMEKLGPSKIAFLSAALFCSGLFGSSWACHIESLPLFYLFFGVVSGVGLGLGYIAPVATLVKWFPDRRGLATGLAIMGFGFGGLICANLIDIFVPKQAELVLPSKIKAYHYLQIKSATPKQAEILIKDAPSVPELDHITHQLSELSRDQQTNTAEFKQLDSINQQYKKTVLYDKKSITQAFLFLGIIYLIIMIPSALYLSPPPDGYIQSVLATSAAKRKNKPTAKTTASSTMIGGEMTAKQASRTPGFYGLWLMLFINASCGITVIATAKKMGYEMVHLDITMASYLVMGISLFNGLGRIAWSTLSDAIGRPNTFIAFFLIQIVAFPLLANLTAIPWAFMAVTFIILTCYGGGFSTMPAYISDLFGLKDMQTILGFILTAWSAAGIVGPSISNFVYEKTGSYQDTLYIFGAAFILALIIGIFMRFETKRIHRHYLNQEMEN